MSSGEYGDLYTPTRKKAWFDTLSAPAQEWLEGLAEHVGEHGEPTWAAVHRKFKELFPEDCPETAQTVMHATRRLVDGL